MNRYALLLLAAIALGCGRSQPPAPAPAPAASSLPPEVEHDPETATKLYQKNKAPKR